MSRNEMKQNRTDVLRDEHGQDRFTRRSSNRRRLINVGFMSVCISIASASIMILGLMITFIGYKGVGALIQPGFLTSLPSNIPDESGIGPALMGTIWACGFCALITLPLGVGTAILLEEFQPNNRLLRWLHRLVQLNITNLAGVPSVVYGIIGLTAFVFIFGLFDQRQPPWLEFGADHYDQFRSVYRGERGEIYVLRFEVEDSQSKPTQVESGMMALDPYGQEVEVVFLERGQTASSDPEVQKRTIRWSEQASRYPERHWYYVRFPIGRGILAGSLTLMLVILPVVIISSQESLRAVPRSLREGALGLGATPWQVIRNVTLPASIPGIMTGSILAMSRAIGETAPILIIAGTVYVSFFPNSIADDFTVIPLQVYAWAREPNSDYHDLAAAGIVVLLMILLSFNAIAVFIRQLTQKPLS